jgi:hypothetical protein
VHYFREDIWEDEPLCLTQESIMSNRELQPEHLPEGRTAPRRISTERSPSVLVVGEMSLVLVPFIGAGLLIGSFIDLQAVRSWVGRYSEIDDGPR